MRDLSDHVSKIVRNPIVVLTIMRIARAVTTTTMFSLTPFRQNISEIVGTFESYMKGQHRNLARRATQSYAVQLRRPMLCSAELR